MAASCCGITECERCDTPFKDDDDIWPEEVETVDGDGDPDWYWIHYCAKCSKFL